jgi:spermidine/putrescine transport system ATP-binding protein
MAEFLAFEGISKHFGPVCAVDHVSFTVKQGEIFSLLGPSGCGKTTLLRILGGFEEPDSGRILLNGQDLADLPPNQRKVNTIFQNYALFPHLTVRQNIAFGLQIAKRPAREIRTEVDRMLDLIQMTDQAHKKPHLISGGQKQRVAIARALILKPQILLLDEPLAALDLKLRQRMLIELDQIHDTVGITFIYVTHDQGESMSLSDHIAVMNKGRIEQIGSPSEIYEAPRSSFVAAFIGDTNILEGQVMELYPQNNYCKLQLDGFPSTVLCYNDNNIKAGTTVYLSVRPEKFHVALEKPEAKLHPEHNCVPGKVEDMVYMGAHTKFWVRVGDYRLAITQQHRRFLLDEAPIKWNDPVWVYWHGDDGFMLERYNESDEKINDPTVENAATASKTSR